MSGRVLPLPGDEHAAVQALLPWHLNGTLDEAESAQVAAHLAGCAACRAELAGERRLQALHAGLGVAAGDAAADWAALQRRLRPAMPAPGVSTWWRRLAVAQLALLPLLLALWALTPRYALQGGAVHEASAVLRLRPDTPEQEIRRLLRESGARLVGGPTLSDAYLIELPPATAASAIERLRAAPQVLLVESLEARGAR